MVSLRRGLLLSLGLFLIPDRSSSATVVTSLGSEFTSPLTETWESFPLDFLTNHIPTSVPILNGGASAKGASLVTYIPGVFGPGHFGLGPFTAKVHDGKQGFGVSSSQASVTFSFAEPIIRFGGFWGISSDTQPVKVTFLDADDEVLGTTEFFYSRPNNDGTLEWHGWQISTPVTKVTMSGAFFVNDALRVTQVPEPSSAVLIAIGALAFTSSRTYRRERRS
jgi:hypothetical protein